MASAAQHAGGIQPSAAFTPRGETPKQAAQAILAETRGAIDRTGMIEARIDTLAKSDPELAAAVRKEIMASPLLTIVQKGELSRNERGTTVDLGNGRVDRFSPDGINQDVYINRERAANSPKYQQYVRLTDGVATNDAIKAVMAQLLASGQTLEQAETAKANKQSAEMLDLTLDLAKVGLDLAGIVDQFGVSDTLSMGISLYQGEYWDAFMSGLALVPVVGAAAVLGKLGKWGEVVKKAIKLAEASPLNRKLLEPALKGISDTLNAIPVAAYKAMPDSARTALEAIKSRLDNLLGKAEKKVDDLVPPRPAMVDGGPQTYFDDAGKKGAWNKELNGKLTPNADYHVNGYKFSTDAEGRVSSVSGELTMTTAERATYQQRKVGKSGDAGDEGGHLIASSFNGPGEAVNLKAMNGNFNKGAFKKMENMLADAVASGKKVTVKIDVIHAGDASRPTGFRFEYSIDGVKSVRNFENKAGG
jgi:hypothetical protein